MSIQQEEHFCNKRDPNQEEKVRERMETVLGMCFVPNFPYEDLLQDGQLLCRVINKLKPGSVPEVYETGGQLQMIDNVNNFLNAIEAYGVPKNDIFEAGDLYEKKDISRVTACLYALGRASQNHPEWSGPWLGLGAENQSYYLDRSTEEDEIQLEVSAVIRSREVN